jgi:hypothetical protein
LRAGDALKPHPARVTIRLAGDRGTQGVAISNDLVLGAKVGPGLAACVLNPAPVWLRNQILA